MIVENFNLMIGIPMIVENGYTNMVIYHKNVFIKQIYFLDID